MIIISSTPSIITGEQKLSGTRLTAQTLTHLLTTDNIGQPTEEQLSNQSTNGGSDLDSEVLIDVEFTAWK